MSAQAANFEKDLNQAVVPAGQKVAKTLATAIGGAFVLSKIKGFAKAGIDELKEAEAAQAQTAAAIKSTGGVANVTAESVDKLSASLLKQTGVDDELITKGQNLLLTFTSVRNEVGKGNDVFDQATKAALDLSQAGFGSVESASVLLGKALNDPLVGLTALQRVGVRLSDSTKETVKALVAQGDTLAAQKLILQEVNTQVGGSAEAFGKTLPGQLAIAEQSMENTKAAMLAGMAPALAFTAKSVTFLTDEFAKQPEVLQQIEGGLILTVGALGSIITPLKSGIDLWRSFGSAAKAATAAETVGGLAPAGAAAAGGVGKLGKALGGLGFVAAIGGAAYFASTLSRTTVDVNKAAAALRNLSDADAEHVQKAILVSDRLGELDSQVRQLADGNVIAARRFVEQAAAAGLSGDRIAELTAIIDKKKSSDVTGAEDQAAYSAEVQAATGPVDDLASGTLDLADATDTSAKVTKTWAERIDEARTAIDELFDATNSAVTGSLDYKDAVDSATDAVADLREKQRDGVSSADDVRRATDDAARSMLGQAQAAVDSAEATAELAGQHLDAGTKARVQKEELQRLATTLAPGDPLRQQLEGFITDLERVPGSKTISFSVEGVDEAVAEIERLMRAGASIPGDVFWGLLTSLGAAGLAEGGLITEAVYRASGGGFPGGPRGSDTVPLWATPGEFMMQKSAVDRWGVGFMEQLNSGGTPMASGGQVSQPAPAGDLLVQNIYTLDPIQAAAESARRHRAVRVALERR